MCEIKACCIRFCGVFPAVVGISVNPNTFRLFSHSRVFIGLSGWLSGLVTVDGLSLAAAGKSENPNSWRLAVSEISLKCR